MPTLLEKYVAVAYSACAAATVHTSLALWAPSPSVTHAPSVVTWQYAEPDATRHIKTVGGAVGLDLVSESVHLFGEPYEEKSRKEARVQQTPLAVVLREQLHGQSWKK